jgi:ATP-dependent Lon protease
MERMNGGERMGENEWGRTNGTGRRFLTKRTLAESQAVLSSTSVPRRLAIALAVVETDAAVRKKQQEISKKLEEKTTQDQREFFLREQLKMVRKELGMERDEKEELIEKYRARLTPEVPKEAMKVIDDELAKLQMLEPSSSEYSITRNYLDWLTILPWGVYPRRMHAISKLGVNVDCVFMSFDCNRHSKENFDLKHAREVLEEDHYGLKDIRTA